MNNTQTQILNLIDLALHGKENNITEAYDWDVIFDELKAQAVIGIPLEYMVKNIDAPKEQKERWTKMVYSQVAKWTNLMEEQSKLIDLLNKNNIKFAIIKGITAAMNYPKPDYRSMGDVDFFVEVNDYKEFIQMMQDNGYRCERDDEYIEIQLKKDDFSHIVFIKNEIKFEPHMSMPSTIQGKEIDKKTNDLALEEMNYLVKNKVGQYEFPMFEMKFNGLVILRHIIQHIGRGGGVGLRHIIDWMMFVEKNVDDNFWNNEFAEYLDQVHLKDAAIIFARMAQIYLGLDDNIVWCKETDDGLCEEWMEQILASGNFGSKQTKADEGAGVLYKNKNVFTMVKSLQGLGLSHWEAARKHKILRPFAWAYQAGRYARKGLGRKAPIKSLKEDMNKSRYKKELLEKLNV